MRKIKNRIKKIFGIRNDIAVIRKDLVKLELDSNTELLVYWKVLKIGKGPALILRSYDKEILKFDCFGENKGHYHVSPAYSQRIYFCEATAEEQVKRSIQELCCNGQKYLSIQPELKIQKIQLDHNKVVEQSKRAQEILLGYLRNVPELQKL